MSDTPQGPGWWQASDLKWYPPQSTDAAPPPPPPPPPGAQDDPPPPPPPSDSSDVGEAGGGDAPPPPPPPDSSDVGEAGAGDAPPPGDSSGLSKKLLLAGAAAVLVLAVVGGALLLMNRDNPVEFEGQGSAEDAELIAALDTAAREMDDAATRENATIADDANCFLSKRSESAEAANSFIRCGPVLFVDAPSRAAQWMTADLYIPDESSSGGGFDGDRERPAVSVGPLQRFAELSSGEFLFRPDGVEPSDEELDFPDPEPVSSDFFVVVDEQIGVDLESVDGGLVGIGFSMDIAGYATVERLGEGAEALIAPDGSELLVVRYEWSPNDRGGSRPAFAVSVDGTNRSVELPQGKGTLIAAVPESAEDLGINAAEDTIDQTLSLTTGERSGDTPAILYRDAASKSIAVNSTIQIPTAKVCLDQFCREAEGVVTQIVLGQAELAWTPATSSLTGYRASDAAASGADKAWLLLEVRSFDNVTASGSATRPTFTSNMIRLEVGEEQIAPSTGLERQGVLAFEVPADITEAKLVFTPGDNVLPVSGSGYVLNYGQTAGEAAITFPEG